MPAVRKMDAFEIENPKPMASTVKTTRINTPKSNELKADVLYVLERLENAMFNPDAEFERDQILDRLNEGGYTLFDNLDEILSEDKLTAFLRMQANGFNPSSKIKLVGKPNNLADSINVVLIDEAFYAVGVNTKMFSEPDVAECRKQVAWTKYKVLLQR